MTAPAEGPAAAFLRRQGAGTHAFGAFVTAIAATRDGRWFGFALGDGTVRLVRPGRPAEALTAEAHGGGACLALAPDVDPGALLSGGDDGRLVRVAPGEGGEPAALARWRGKWVGALDAHPRPRLRAAAAGKTVHLLGRDGAEVQALEHPSTAAGVAFDPSGQRLAVAHYGGVSLWVGYKDGWRPTLLPWAGSHLAVTWSPSGKFVVSTTQENELHGWRLATKADMRMAGYPARVTSMGWAARGRWLATSGARGAVLWPFKGEEGPAGKSPVELARGAELATAVAAHPSQPLVAVGHKDGAVQLARVMGDDALELVAAGGPGGPVSALAWTPDGAALAIGTEGGWAAVVPLAAPAGAG